MEDTVLKTYGNRTRIRVCGILVRNGKILLVKHRMAVHQVVWMPPGGGLEFGEDCSSCLVREVKEETGLDVEVGAFLFVTEYAQNQLHAVELFFEIKVKAGTLAAGYDPETMDRQIIEDVKFMGNTDLAAIPGSNLHGLFGFAPKIDQITGLKGYFKL